MSNLISPSMHNGELRILDTDLATRLGFDRPRDIRKLIKRYEAELGEMGVCAAVALTSGETGGRPGTAYYLNEEQALFITAKSETAAATKITIEIVTQFAAFKRGEVSAHQLAIPSHAEALRMAADLVEKNQTLLNTVEIRQRELAEAAPKVAALEQLASLDGFHTLTQAAKSCGWPRDHFIQECSARHWIYRDKAKKIWMGYSDKEKAGLLDYKPFEYAGSDGHVKAKPQVVFTSKGLSRVKLLIGVYRKEAPRPFARKPEPAS